MQEAHIKEMKHKLSGFLGQTPPFLGKSLLIFGHCNPAEEMAEYLAENGVSVLCYLDNNVEKQGEMIGNTPVYSPNYIKNHTNEDSIVLVVSRYFAPMQHQLRQLAYEGDVVEVVEYSSFQAFSTSSETFSQKKERVCLGGKLLTQLRETWEGEHLVLCPNRALGDVYVALGYLKAYLKAKNISSYAVLVVGNPCKQVAELFETEKVKVLEQKSMDALVQAICFFQEENAILAHHNHVYYDPSFQILSQEFIHFEDYYRDIVFELPTNTQMELVKSKKDGDFSALMPKGKSVIFAPYANSVVEAPMDFWEEMVEGYKKQGFALFTNVISGQEPILGTKPLDLPLTDMISAVEWAGHFVSLRSGICDVVQGAKAVKKVVFPDCCFSTTKHKISDFFSMKGWEAVLLNEENEVVR